MVYTCHNIINHGSLVQLAGAACWCSLLVQLAGAACWCSLLVQLAGAACWCSLLETGVCIAADWKKQKHVSITIII